jgi:hypothetical protein
MSRTSLLERGADAAGALAAVLGGVLLGGPVQDDICECPNSPAWARGTDGVGPALLDADGATVRWLLVDGKVYDIRADLNPPSWQKGRWTVNGWRAAGGRGP